MSNRETSRNCATGISGLDHILVGGFPRDRFYLVEGDPGVGKTTLGLQFLLEGVRVGEKGLYVTLSESRDELLQVAAAHGWSLDGIAVVELSAIEEQLAADAQTTLLHPAEVELTQTTSVITAEVERVRPQRVVLDSLSELRLLAGSPLRYRRQILALKQFFIGKNCTVLLLDEGSIDERDVQVQSIAHGVITLKNMAPDYGGERRRLRVLKLRGIDFRGGFHDYVIRRGGLIVFPRLVAADDRHPPEGGKLASGIPGLDALTGGGLDWCTSNLLIGPAGTGKSVLATSYIAAATNAGLRVAFYTFDETISLLRNRAPVVKLDLDKHLGSGLLVVQQVDPAESSPGEFADKVRAEVRAGARLVVIDSLNGYLAAMPDERHLVLHLHELNSFCTQCGALTLMLAEQKGLVGPMQTQIDVTYLADTVVVLRHFEAAGEMRQAISMMKKRSGGHERFIRELKIDASGVRVGQPLHDFQGVLTGTPVFHGKQDSMLPSRHGEQ